MVPTVETKIHFETRNGLSEGTRENMVALLNKRLADLSVLRGLSKQMHWNVKGPHFQQLHELFDASAALLDEPVDDVAERAVMLGGLAEGTLRMAVRTSDLADIDISVTEGMSAVKALADRWGEVTNHMREAIDTASEAGDEATVDLLTEITRLMDKQLWFIEAHLQVDAR